MITLFQRAFFKARVKFQAVAIRSLLYLGILVLLRSCTVIDAEDPRDRSFTLSSGLMGGHYNECAKRIAAHINANQENKVILPLPSEGSLQNMDRLVEGVADMAIVQRDVLEARYHARNDPFTEIEIVAPLFPEALQILFHHDSLRGIVDLDRFQELVSRGDIRQMAIGASGTVSNTTARSVLDLLGLEVPQSFYLQISPYESMGRFELGEIQAIALLSGAPVRGLTYPLGFELGVLNFSKREVTTVTSYLRSLEPVTQQMSVYEGEDTVSFTTLGTWALLVGRKGITHDLHAMIKVDPVEIILAALESGDVTQRQLFDGGSTLQCSGPSGARSIRLTLERPQDFFRGISISDGLATAMGISQDSWTDRFAKSILVLAGLTLGLIVFYARMVRTEHHRRYKRIWRRFRQFAFAGVIFLAIAALLPPLIDRLERSFCQRYGVPSSFLNVSMEDKYTWLLVLSLSGNTNDIFPVGGWARVVTAAGMVLNYINVAFLTGHTLVKEHRLRRRLNGTAMINSNGHIVICGWNQNAGKLINDLLQDQQEYSGNSRMIVLVHPRATDHLKADERLKDDFSEAVMVRAINDDPKKDRALQLCNLEAAHTVILLADNDCDDPDDRTLVRASSIIRYLQEKDLEKKIYVIAEAANDGLKEAFVRNGVDEVVCSSHFMANVLFQSSINHGVSSVFEEIVDHKQGNEFYSIPVAGRDELIGQTFDELLVCLRKHEVLLLGIRSQGLPLQHAQRKRRTTLPSFLRPRDTPVIQHEVGTRVTINPAAGMESDYKTQAGDDLLVLAESRVKLKSMLKEIRS